MWWAYKIIVIMLYSDPVGLVRRKDGTFLLDLAPFCARYNVRRKMVKQYFGELERIGLVSDMSITRSFIEGRLKTPTMRGSDD